MNDFFSNNVLKQNIDSIGTSSNIDNFESNNASNKQPISDDNTELIITKATQNKTSTVSKNGRTISRIHEVISKFNKTIENAEQKNETEIQNQNIFNLYLYWYFVLQELKHKVTNDLVEQKINTVINFSEKFDKNESETYLKYLKYIKNQLGNNLEMLFNQKGIQPNNFLYKNFINDDLFGFDTFYQDTYYTYDDLFDNKLDKNIDNINLYNEMKDYSTNVDQNNDSKTVPQIIHIIYYKNTIDYTFLDNVIKMYQNLPKFMIYIWFDKKPSNQCKYKNVYYQDINKYKDEYLNLVNENSTNNTNVFKYLIKYLILREYGGIYIDIKNILIKNFSSSLLESSFISINQKVVKQLNYMYPLGYLMGFSANHKFVNYVIDNFVNGLNIFKTEESFLRSLLYKSQDVDVKLLFQNPNALNNNNYYISNYTIDEIESYKYFTHDDFDIENNNPESVDSETIQSETIQSESIQSEPVDSETTDENNLLNELNEIDMIANNCINRKKEEQNDSFMMLLFFIMSTLFGFYLFN